MKDNEFSEKVPILVTLHDSTILFKKGNYDHSIKMLEDVLKKDLKSTHSTTIRGDAYFNLSVNYVMVDEFEKAIDAITQAIPFTTMKNYYGVFFDKSANLTKEQTKMLEKNYRFNDYSNFTQSSKYKKKFKLFVNSLENRFSRIKEEFETEPLENFKSALNNFFKILSLSYLYLDNSYIGHIDSLHNPKTPPPERIIKLYNKAVNLMNSIIEKEKQALLQSLDKDIRESEELIKAEKYTEAMEKLNYILEDYYDFKRPKISSSYTDYSLDMKKNQLYQTDERFRTIIDLLILIEKKEEEDKKKEEEDKNNERKNAKDLLKSELLKASNMIQENQFKDIEKNLKELLEQAKSMEFKDIVEQTKELLKDSKNKKQRNETEEEFRELENLVKEYDLSRALQMNNIEAVSTFFSKRPSYKLPAIYGKYLNNYELKMDATDLVVKFYSQHLDFNPFKGNVGLFATIYNGIKKSEISHLEDNLKILDGKSRSRALNRRKEKTEEEIEIDKSVSEKLHNLHEKLIGIDYSELIYKYLKKIGEEIKELNYDVPLAIMYKFLLDFSNLFTNNPKIEELSNDVEYTLKGSYGNFNFKFLEKEVNRKIVYEYNFLNNTQIGEKGRFTIDFIEEAPGKVKLKIKNEIEEISKENRENLKILNYLGSNFGALINLILAKLVAKQVQTVIYEKSFDDLTMGNYRILQAKFNALGKDINKLKAKFFEVKSPLTLSSFECSECGATLNITSKEEKFIICEHCSTPFLMEWQKD